MDQATRSSKLESFNVEDVPKSTTLHLDYTGPLPAPCTSGTRYFLIAVWGSYIHIEPLTTLRAAQTTAALQRTVIFFRRYHVDIQTIRMDNQTEEC